MKLIKFSLMIICLVNLGKGFLLKNENTQDRILQTVEADADASIVIENDNVDQGSSGDQESSGDQGNNEQQQDGQGGEGDVDVNQEVNIDENGEEQQDGGDEQQQDGGEEQQEDGGDEQQDDGTTVVIIGDNAGDVDLDNVDNVDTVIIVGDNDGNQDDQNNDEDLVNVEEPTSQEDNTDLFSLYNYNDDTVETHEDFFNRSSDLLEYVRYETKDKFESCDGEECTDEIKQEFYTKVYARIKGILMRLFKLKP